MHTEEDFRKKVTEIVDQYSISHKGNVQCKCISGARGHLIAKLTEYVKNQADYSWKQGVRYNQSKTK